MACLFKVMLNKKSLFIGIVSMGFITILCSIKINKLVMIAKTVILKSKCLTFTIYSCSNFNRNVMLESGDFNINNSFLCLYY